MFEDHVRTYPLSDDFRSFVVILWCDRLLLSIVAQHTRHCVERWDFFNTSVAWPHALYFRTFSAIQIESFIEALAPALGEDVEVTKTPKVGIKITHAPPSPPSSIGRQKEPMPPPSPPPSSRPPPFPVHPPVPPGAYLSEFVIFEIDLSGFVARRARQLQGDGAFTLEDVAASIAEYLRVDAAAVELDAIGARLTIKVKGSCPALLVSNGLHKFEWLADLGSRLGLQQPPSLVVPPSCVQLVENVISPPFPPIVAGEKDRVSINLDEEGGSSALTIVMIVLGVLCSCCCICACAIFLRNRSKIAGDAANLDISVDTHVKGAGGRRSTRHARFDMDKQPPTVHATSSEMMRRFTSIPIDAITRLASPSKRRIFPDELEGLSRPSPPLEPMRVSDVDVEMSTGKRQTGFDTAAMKSGLEENSNRPLRTNQV